MSTKTTFPWYHWGRLTPDITLRRLMMASGGSAVNVAFVMNVLRIGFSLALTELTPDLTLHGIAKKRLDRDAAGRRRLTMDILREYVFGLDDQDWRKCSVSDIVRNSDRLFSILHPVVDSVNLRLAGTGQCRKCFLVLASRAELGIAELLEQYWPEHSELGRVLSQALRRVEQFVDLPIGLCRPSDAVVRWDEELELGLAPDIFRQLETLTGMTVGATTWLPDAPRISHDEGRDMEHTDQLTVNSVVQNVILHFGEATRAIQNSNGASDGGW